MREHPITPEDQRKIFFQKILSLIKCGIELRALPIAECPFVRRIFTRDLNAIEKFIEENKNDNLYFGVYTREGGGTKHHVKEIFCYFADIDFKHYPGGEGEAWERLNAFIKSTGLKPTFIIHSGNGLHVYWFLNCIIEPSQKVEAILRGIAKHLGADLSVCELARVMRIPGTFNDKNGEKKPVTILEHNDVSYDPKVFDQFEDNDDFKNNDSSEFKKDLTKHIEKINEKCSFLKYCYENSAGLPEPLWFGMISNLARYSYKPFDLCHGYSKNYPKYTWKETEEKIKHCLNDAGPHTCQWIKDQGFDCEKSCGVTSPIVLINKQDFQKELDLGEELLKLDGPYFINADGYLCRWKQTREGYIPVRLANFDAKIVEEIIEDNGIEVTHSYGIEGKTKGGTLPKVEIPAGQFNTLNWLHKWGNTAILEPGQMTKDYVRHSIQVCSNGIQHKTYYTHTGWRQINGLRVYLTNSGSIGGDNISVRLSRELQRYDLPLASQNELEAIKTSLSFLDIGKREITLPLLSLLYLSPMTTILEPMPNFSGMIFGETGLLKSTLAILLLSHFGPFNSVTLLNNFEDTPNALEKRAFILKDVLMVLDDFNPSIKRIDAQHKEQLAQRIIRSFSNRTGRARLNSDTSDKGRYEPRGLLLITGEEIVSLQSTLARLMIIEISEGDISKTKLSEIQAKAYHLPNAMASYITWLRENLEKIQSAFPKQFIQLRDKATRQNTHKKIPEQIAFLQFSLDTVISWMVDKNVLNENEAMALSQEGWENFTALSEKQTLRIEKEDPVKRFVEIFQTLIAQGKVKIEDKDDSELFRGSLSGEHVGYYDENYIYLSGPAIWHSLQRYCISEGSHFPVSKNTLFSIFRKRNLIETRGNDNTIDSRIRGEVKRVLKFIGGGILQNGVTNVTGDRDA